MCGIAGALNFNREAVSPTEIKRMTEAIKHRGPDGEGHYVSKNVALGHRRLAIIDLSPLGHQPMMTENKRYVITYNGELYNFQEMRIELESLGYQFRSKTDTEVVLNAYAEWGPECLGRFNGMFAFAIWDEVEQELFLARDRYGIKPLYFTQQGSTFLFGSEIKALIAQGSYQTKINKEALLEYFTFQNFFTDKTLFAGVHLFPAGCWMKIEGGLKSAPEPQRYWDYNFIESASPGTEDEYLEELDRLFKQAVKRQLISDVDVGSYLSGGMDSGSITAVAAKQLPFMKSFTVGFDLSSASGVELAFDERKKAEHMSYQFKTEHYEMVLKAGDMERILPKMSLHLEEPRVGQSYPNFYAAQLASKFVKVVLSGVGGDELFAGYPWRYYRAVINDDFEHYIDKYYSFWQRLIPNVHIRQVFSPIWKDVQNVWTRDIFRDVFPREQAPITPEDYVNSSLYFEAKTFLSGLLLVEDKLSMAHSLETRVPFLDNDLVDFAMKVPTKFKLGNLREVVRLNENEPGPKTTKFFDQTRDGKLLLRKAMRRHIPDAVTDREKQGFSAPDSSWFKGESIEYVRRIVGDSKSPIYDFLDKTAINSLVNEHLEGRVNRRLLIWSILNFHNWCKSFL